MSLDSLIFRAPEATDAAAVWTLVRDSGELELNSGYAYVLVCTHFAATSLVAEAAGEIVGFVAAYRPPSDPDSLFVWQVGVGEQARGRKIGLRMLLRAAERCPDAIYLTATVATDNAPSDRLFRAFARERSAPVKVETGFPAELFPGSGHADEPLYRIGPLE